MTVENPVETVLEAAKSAITAGEKASIGLKSAVEIALRETNGRGVHVPADQLPLLPTEATIEPEEQQITPESRGRGGRPKGSRSRNTEAMREFLVSRYRSPLVVLAEIYGRPVAVLAAELGCTLHDAFALQAQAAIQSLPYWHQKQPLAVQIDSRGVTRLELVVPSAQAGMSHGEVSTGLVLEAQVVSEANQ